MIRSSDNSKIKLIKSLKLKKHREKFCKYIIEGEIIVFEYIKRSDLVEYIMYSEKYLDKEILLIECEKRNIEAYEIEEKLFKDIIDTINSQGIIGVIKKKEENFDSIIKGNTILYLDNLQDPGNMGTMIRSADAFGMVSVIISKGCTDVYNSKSVRASMGSLIRVPVYVTSNNVETLKILKENDFIIYCTDLKANNNIKNTTFADKRVIIIGNESKGVSEKIKNFSDEFIKIEISDNVQSLNASIAASIILYEIYEGKVEKIS